MVCLSEMKATVIRRQVDAEGSLAAVHTWPLATVEVIRRWTSTQSVHEYLTTAGHRLKAGVTFR